MYSRALLRSPDDKHRIGSRVFLACVGGVWCTRWRSQLRISFSFVVAGFIRPRAVYGGLSSAD